MSRVAESFQVPPWAATTSRRAWSQTCSESTRTPSMSKMTPTSRPSGREGEPQASPRSDASRRASRRLMRRPAASGRGRCRRARRARRGSRARTRRPARQATKTWRLGGTPVSGTITTPAGGAVCASRGTSEMPRPPATSPITACQSPARCATLGEKPALRQPARKTSSQDQPTGGATQPSRRELGEVDAGAAGERVIGRQDGVQHVPQQLLAVEARVVAPRRGRALHAEDQVHVAGDEHGRPPRASRPPGCAA